MKEDTEYDNNDQLLKCDDCDKVDETVHKTTCPYNEEISNETIECQLCNECYHERCMDI